MKTYRVRREWTVVMESWVTVRAESAEAACRLALADEDFDDQSIAEGSDGPTYIGKIERRGLEVAMPPGYPGVPPAGVPWESWLAAHNVD